MKEGLFAKSKPPPSLKENTVGVPEHVPAVVVIVWFGVKLPAKAPHDKVSVNAGPPENSFSVLLKVY